MLISCFTKMVLAGSVLTASTGVGLGLLTSSRETVVKTTNTQKEIKTIPVVSPEVKIEKKVPTCRIYKIENRSTGQVSRVDISKIELGSEAYEKVKKACESKEENDVFVEYKYQVSWYFWNSGKTWVYSKSDQQNPEIRRYLDSHPELKN